MDDSLTTPYARLRCHRDSPEVSVTAPDRATVWERYTLTTTGLYAALSRLSPEDNGRAVDHLHRSPRDAGRRRTTSERVTVAATVTDATAARVIAMADAEGVTRSAWIARAIEAAVRGGTP